MTQIPLLSGITATERADFDLSYPVNLEPVPTESGISQGYIRSAMGAADFAEGPGIDRGGIVWNGLHYRVMGTKLVTVSPTGTVAEVGDVGAGDTATFDYGFGRLAIRSGTRLYYWDGITLVQVTDPDLGPCIDVAWFQGQYFSTDGSYIVATQINDPTAVDPNKYGSAESDPDTVRGLLRIRDALYAFGGNTIEEFDYVGGTGFPLQVSQGATIPIGCVGPQAKCPYAQTFAFVGAARNEAIAAWLGGGGTATKISTRSIDDMLAAEPNPAGIQLESRTSRDEERLYIHLSDRTLVFLRTASQKTGKPVWYVAMSGIGFDKPYRPRGAVLYEGKWIVGDTETAKLGVLDEATAEHFGEKVGWRFDTMLIYNGAKGGILHNLELVGLPGRAALGEAPVAFLSMTTDGETWTVERAAALGKRGDRAKRMAWRPHKRIRNYLGCRFRGDSSSLAGFAALEAAIEPLTV